LGDFVGFLIFTVTLLVSIVILFFGIILQIRLVLIAALSMSIVVFILGIILGIRFILKIIFRKLSNKKATLISALMVLIPFLLFAVVVTLEVQRIKKQHISPSRITRSWQTILVDGVASFKVPGEWVVEQEDGIIFITDTPRQFGEYNIYIVGIVREKVIDTGVRHTYPHELIDGVEMGNWIRGNVFSNGSRLYWYEYYVNDEILERAFIEFNNDTRLDTELVYLLIWNDDIVTDDIIEDIAKTFRPEV
jgi:hypothetical protein